jgi:hypothetical protein
MQKADNWLRMCRRSNCSVVLHEFYFPLSFLELDGEPLPPSLQPLHAPGLELIQTDHRST